MGNSRVVQNNSASPIHTPADQDRFGEHRGLGVSIITFKVMPTNDDDTFILENTFHEKGGPARHLHFDQDEWFYVVEGEFLLEVGQEPYRPKPGDSLLGPSKVPHVWLIQAEDAAGSWSLLCLPENGSLLSGSHQSQRYAASGSRTVASL